MTRQFSIASAAFSQICICIAAFFLASNHLRPQFLAQPSFSQEGMPLQREVCPEYDVEVLYDVLLNHARSEGAKVAFAFGVYDAVQTGHAVRGSALLRCSGVLKAMLAATPQGIGEVLGPQDVPQERRHADARTPAGTMAQLLAGRLGWTHSRAVHGVAGASAPASPFISEARSEQLEAERARAGRTCRPLVQAGA